MADRASFKPLRRRHFSSIPLPKDISVVYLVPPPLACTSYLSEDAASSPNRAHADLEAIAREE